MKIRYARNKSSTHHKKLLLVCQKKYNGSKINSLRTRSSLIKLSKSWVSRKSCNYHRIINYHLIIKYYHSLYENHNSIGQFFDKHFATWLGRFIDTYYKPFPLPCIYFNAYLLQTISTSLYLFQCIFITNHFHFPIFILMHIYFNAYLLQTISTSLYLFQCIFISMHNLFRWNIFIFVNAEASSKGVLIFAQTFIAIGFLKHIECDL